MTAVSFRSHTLTGTPRGYSFKVPENDVRDNALTQ